PDLIQATVFAFRPFFIKIHVISNFSLYTRKIAIFSGWLFGARAQLQNKGSMAFSNHFLIAPALVGSWQLYFGLSTV
ncbi:hypothetical protein, partial [Actinobacillus pleuropneumoniae]|uniref:hypothetical protein n=1 Tax=Actinobacillus pleuropneumoniae TaxID=715 RepID=UPI00227D5DB1